MHLVKWISKFICLKLMNIVDSSIQQKIQLRNCKVTKLQLILDWNEQ